MYLYIHGFNSAPASVKARQLQTRLALAGRGGEFTCPALSHWPDGAMAQLESIVAAAPQTSPPVLVGSSLGGFYATWLAERHGCRAVLVNPAITPHLGLHSYLGPQRNLHTGEAYSLTPAHLDQMRAYAVAQPTRMERYLVMVTTGDELLDWRVTIAHYPGARSVVVQGSDHGFTDFEQHLEAVLAFGDTAAASGQPL
jgi:predicted esterase YcpF (UPF0227 family)